MKRALYLHGFASIPDGRKARQLRQMLTPDGVELVAPDLNVPSFERLDFDAMTGVASEAARRTNPDVIVGSSLGALVALAISPSRPHVPLVLIAAPLGCCSIFIDRLPATGEIRVPHQGFGDELATIHRTFFHQMAVCKVEESPPPAVVTAFAGARDETVDVARVRRRWQEWLQSGSLREESSLVVVEDADHSLLNALDQIAAAIARATNAAR